MNNKNLIRLSILMSFALAFSSCDKDEVTEPDIVNEEEVITTLNMTLTPVLGGTTVELSWQDLDVDGSDDPVISVSSDLEANTVYVATLLLLNETETPADTVNVEIEEEALEHQFFFDIDGLNASHAYSDLDSEGNPLGLLNVISTTDASEGSIGIVLRHEPDKNADGVATGDITNAGGESELDVSFDVVIQ